MKTDLREQLIKDFAKYPLKTRQLFFRLFDWLMTYDFKVSRSRKRDGKPGETVKFSKRAQQVSSVQISPAGDIHLHFGSKAFGSIGLLDDLRETLFVDINPRVIGDSNHTAHNITSGQKLILTGSDYDIADLIIDKLSPLLIRI